jgi:prepilin-type processing-associated H-X9-DG protein
MRQGELGDAMVWRRECFLASAICLGLSAPALADSTRDAVMSGAGRCEGIPDNRVWLDCFYGSAQPMRNLLGLSPAPDNQTRLVPGPGAAYGGAAPRRAPPKEQSGGFLSSLVGNTKPIADDMPMTAYGFRRDGKFNITMADGHVWQQAESDIRLAKWNRPAASYEATITNSSAPDLYNLRVNGETYKVTRVR